MSATRSSRLHVRQAIAYSAAAVLLLSLAPSAVVTAARQIRIAAHSYNPASSMIDPALQRAADFIHSQVPADCPILLVVSTPDGWIDGLWHRALYPNPVFLLYKADLGSPLDHELRSQYHIWFAVSRGRPPLDPGFRWQKPLPGWNAAEQVVYGELNQ